MGDDFQTVAQQFCEHYYKTIGESRDELSSMYTDDSCLTYEGESFKGVANIMEKLGGLPKLQMKVETFDAQPSTGKGVVAMVAGQLVIEGNENALKFAQTFHIQEGGSFGWFCLNDIFRLNVS